MIQHLNDKPTTPERVVVLGAGGFVGGAITAALRAHDVDVCALRRDDVDLLAPDASHRFADFLNPGDVVVAVAANAPVKNSGMLIENMVMAKNIVDALLRSSVSHVINISSDAVYGDEPLPLTENSPRAPGSYHGVMHLARELLFETELDVPLAILRPTLIYGLDDPHNGYGPNRFRRLAADGSDIVLFGEGEERRDHVLVSDVAEIVKLVIFNRSIGALNVATGEVASFREIAELVASLFDEQVSISGSPRIGPMPHNGYRPFDISVCENAFPSFTMTPWQAGVKTVHDAFLGQGGDVG